MSTKNRKNRGAASSRPATGDSKAVDRSFAQAERRFFEFFSVVTGNASVGRKKRRGPDATGAPKVSPARWMADSLARVGPWEPQVLETIDDWHRRTVKAKTAKRLQAWEDELLPTFRRKIATLNQHESPEAVMLGLVAVPLIARLGGGWSMAQSSKDLTAESRQAWLESLWELAAAAEAAPASDQLPIKSLGIELGISLCWVLERPQEIHDRYLVQEFESIVEANLDGDGFPAGPWLDGFAAIAASWTRSVHLLRDLGAELDFEVESQLEWMVRQCLRLRRHDRRMSFSSPPGSKREGDDFWSALTRVSRDADERSLLGIVSGKGAAKTGGKSITPLQADEIDTPYNLSEWASAAVLRATWRPKSPQLAIQFQPRENQLRFEMELGRSRDLMIGSALPVWSIDGHPVDFAPDWDVICECSDDDLDYLELQTESETAKFNRQVLLSRKDEFLLIGDRLVNETAASIDYRCRWPLAPGVSAMAESETREVYLQSMLPGDSDAEGRQPGKIQSLLLPLSLPEWKAERFDGKLALEAGGVVLSQRASGRGQLVPLVWDLNPSRSRRKRTWRQLTVGENRQPVPRDHAVGYRFQLDRDQWIFYRSVATTGNRTCLGENTVAEFMLSRFERDGTVTQLIEVDDE